MYYYILIKKTTFKRCKVTKFNTLEFRSRQNLCPIGLSAVFDLVETILNKKG